MLRSVIPRFCPASSSRLTRYLAPALAAELLGTGTATHLTTLTSNILTLLGSQPCSPYSASDLACLAGQFSYREHPLPCHTNKLNMPALEIKKGA